VYDVSRTDDDVLAAAVVVVGNGECLVDDGGVHRADDQRGLFRVSCDRGSRAPRANVRGLSRSRRATGRAREPRIVLATTTWRLGLPLGPDRAWAALHGLSP
jgi:hypothetical protein